MIDNISFIQKLTSPNPFALVSTRKPDGMTNLMALSWWTYASNHPAMVAICISKKGYSHTLILETMEFGLNIVDASLKDAAFACGTCSGRDIDKPRKFSIDLLEPSKIETKLVAAHKVVLECRVVNVVDASDHSMFLAEVVASHTHPDRKHLFALDGYRALDTA